eukprot:Gb_02629 [translate_table: standard]
MRGKELKVCVPSNLRCPISLDLMTDPVTLSTGITYDRHSIETWLDAGNNFCPVTKQALQNQDLIPNHTLRRLIQDCIASSKISRVRLVESGAIPILLEILPEAGRGISERTLAALDVLCNCTEGRSAAYGHALTIPVIVKKILRVSDLATDFAVSVLSTICRNSSDDSVLLEALQAGAFQKLLVLVQLGCSEKERQRATEVLKLLNKYRGEWECPDTMDLKQVKRS